MEDVTEVFNEVNPVVKNTREGGAGAEELVVPKVIVDMREFRSELPSLLHKRGIEIEPVTLQVPNAHNERLITVDLCSQTPLRL